MNDIQDLDPAGPSVPPSSAPISQGQSPLPESEYQGYIQKYPYAAEPTYFTRPSRFYGPASTWRSWTANDRAVAESLDVSRAGDLSAHLYNAFALKQQARHDGTTKKSRSRSRSKGRVYLAGDDGEDDDTSFVPPDLWTAWPLRAHQVPRDEYNEIGPASEYGRRSNQKPSTALEDALIATTLNHAKERWNQRAPDTKVPDLGHVKRDWKVEQDLTKQQLRDSGLLDGDEPRAKQRDEEEDDNMILNSVAESEETDVPSSPDMVLPEGIQTFSSQAFGAVEDSSSPEDEPSDSNSEDDKPVFSADDEHARRVLLPSTRHILAKLDDLLVGLHKARSAYTAERFRGRSRSQSLPSGTDVTDNERLVRSGSRAASKRKDRRRKPASSPENNESTQEERNSRSRTRSGKRSSSKHRSSLGLRDWSDVLGMAALTGWNTDILARASKRCALLFDQNMMFRTFHETTSDTIDQGDQEPSFDEEYAYVPDDLLDTPVTEAIRSESSTKLVPESHGGYVRSSPACTRCHSFGKPCKPPYPVTYHDDSTYVACARCSSARDLEVPCSGITIRMQDSQEHMPQSDSKICPYPTCARHLSGKPFTKRYRLQRHLKTVHGNQFLPPLATVPGLSATQHFSLRRQESPVSTLSCPIQSCPQNTHVYGRSTRLYEHIKLAHPEFDISTFKRIVSRGGRGKYDRSKLRRRNRDRGSATENSGDDLSGDAQRALQLPGFGSALANI